MMTPRLINDRSLPRANMLAPSLNTNQNPSGTNVVTPPLIINSAPLLTNNNSASSYTPVIGYSIATPKISTTLIINTNTSEFQQGIITENDSPLLPISNNQPKELNTKSGIYIQHFIILK